jgi:hypothetical protein
MILSGQGYGLLPDEFNFLEKLRSRKRRNLIHSGLPYVEPEQEAAQLTASQVAIYKNLKETFHKLAFRTCATERKRYEIMLISEATLVARILFNNTFLTANWVGKNILKLTNCYPVNWTPRVILGTKCYKALPVKATTSEKKFILGFLDPRTNIIETESEPGPCSKYRYQAVDVNGKIMMIDQLKADTYPIANEQIKSLRVGNEVDWEGLEAQHPQIFHSLILSNFSDGQIQLFKTLRFFQHSIEHEFDMSITEHTGEFQTPSINTSFFPDFYLLLELIRKAIVTLYVLLSTGYLVYKFSWPRLFRDGMRRALRREADMESRPPSEGSRRGIRYGLSSARRRRLRENRAKRRRPKC